MDKSSKLPGISREIDDVVQDITDWDRPSGTLTKTLELNKLIGKYYLQFWREVTDKIYAEPKDPES